MSNTPEGNLVFSPEVVAWASGWLKRDREFILHESRHGKPLLKAICELILMTGEAHEK